jgi:hypothetical protein
MIRVNAWTECRISACLIDTSCFDNEDVIPIDIPVLLQKEVDFELFDSFCISSSRYY